MANANIFQQYLQPAKSVLDYQNDYDMADARKAQLQSLQGQNALQALTMDQTRGQMADATAKRNAIQQVYSSLPTTAKPIDRARALQANPLTASEGVAAEKAILENEGKAASTAKDQGDAEAKQIANKKALLEHGILSLQTAQTPDDAIRQVQQGVAQGYWSMQDAQAKLANIPRDQAGFENWRVNQLRAVTEAYRQLPTIQTVDLGGTKTTQAVDPFTGKPTITGAQRVTQSPDNAATVGATVRGQNLTDARAREQISQGKVPAGYRQKGDGTLEFIPGGPADPAAAKKASPTEFQGKSAAFGSRAQEADRILGGLEGKYSQGGINTKQSLGHVWGVGGALEAGANGVLSAQSQQAEQAQRDFVNALLRQESGAAIGAGEFENAARQYFPQPGDKPEVIRQKAANRKLAVQGLLNNAGNAVVATPGPAAGGVLKFDAQGNPVP